MGRSKKTACAVWNVFLELTRALLKFSLPPTELPEEVLRTIERLFIFLWDRIKPRTDFMRQHKKLFIRMDKVKLITPTKTAQHVKRAAYEKGKIWSQSCRQHLAGSEPKLLLGCIFLTGRDCQSSPNLAFIPEYSVIKLKHSLLVIFLAFLLKHKQGSQSDSRNACFFILLFIQKPPFSPVPPVNYLSFKIYTHTFITCSKRVSVDPINDEIV